MMEDPMIGMMKIVTILIGMMKIVTIWGENILTIIMITAIMKIGVQMTLMSSKIDFDRLGVLPIYNAITENAIHFRAGCDCSKSNV